MVQWLAISIHGRAIGYDTETGQLIANRIDITRKAVDATITVSAEGATTANTRDCVVTLLDAKGVAIDHVEEIEVLKKLVIEKMESAMTFDIQLKVDVGVGNNWLEAH